MVLPHISSTTDGNIQELPHESLNKGVVYYIRVEVGLTKTATQDIRMLLTDHAGDLESCDNGNTPVI